MKRKRILVIEDDPDFRNYVRTALCGAELFFVDTLRGALELLESEQFDIVIVDLMLADWKRNPEAMLAFIQMRAKRAAIAAVTGKMENLPTTGCDAAAHKINIGTVDLFLQFIREAERKARSQCIMDRPISALENFVNTLKHAHA